MPFPPAQRVLYRKNPLEQVVCQLRFPPILRIDAELPVGFQDRVRNAFPNFAEASKFKLEVPLAIGEQVPQEILRQVIQSSSIKNYEFSSADGLWKVNLTRTFIALTTTKYERWESFRDRLILPLQALNDIYTPAYFTRIGLRYVDVIRRSKVDLPDVPWRDLVSPPLIGMLGSPDTADSVERFEAVHEIRLAEQGGTARIIAKLVKTVGAPEDFFVIDSDFFDTSRAEIDAAINKLNFFNSRSTRLMRWAITDRLHQALEPQPL